MACAALSGRQGRRAAQFDMVYRASGSTPPVGPTAPPSGSRPGAPSASSRASTVGAATLFGPLLAERAPGRDAGRDPGEKCGLNKDAAHEEAEQAEPEEDHQMRHPRAVPALKKEARAG